MRINYTLYSSSLSGGVVEQTGRGFGTARRNDGLSEGLGEHGSQETAGSAGGGNSEVKST